MALDQNAGKKKAVGLARNLFPTTPSEVIEIANQAVAAATIPNVAPITTVSDALTKSYAGAMTNSSLTNQKLDSNLDIPRDTRGLNLNPKSSSSKDELYTVTTA